MTDEVLTLEEAARFLKVQPAIVSDLLQDEELPGRQIAGEWRTTTRALVSFVDGVPLQQTICCTPGSDCCTPATSEESGLALASVKVCDPSTGCC